MEERTEDIVRQSSKGDWFSASYYPNIAIVNKLHPEHMGEVFCTTYKEVYETRRDKYPKKTHPAENAMYKLALNGVYGDSNSEFSPFYDPQYTMTITLNGQLLLCMLAEQLRQIPNLTMVQINTDGLTVHYPRKYDKGVEAIWKQWEEFTQLDLEAADYTRMFVRDVNNYVSEYENGDVKRKGAYEYEMGWHQNFNHLVIPKAAEAYLLHGTPIRQFIVNHNNDLDFMMRAKIPKSCHLRVLDVNGNAVDRIDSRITRFFVSVNGVVLERISPLKPPAKPGQWKRATKLTDDFYQGVLAELRAQDWSQSGQDLDSQGLPWDERINTKNMSQYPPERQGSESPAGHLVTECNDIRKFDRSLLNYDYYIAEAEKLVKPFKDQLTPKLTLL